MIRRKGTISTVVIVLAIVAFIASIAGEAGRIGAICKDGTRSSATGSGACSHHGGVSRWLYSEAPTTSVQPRVYRPSTPTALTASEASSSEVALEWSDKSATETGFGIQRRPWGGTYVRIATVGENVTTYVDKTVKPGTRYYYRVYAYDSSGYSTYSDEIGVRTSGTSDELQLTRRILIVGIVGCLVLAALSFIVEF